MMLAKYGRFTVILTLIPGLGLRLQWSWKCSIYQLLALLCICWLAIYAACVNVSEAGSQSQSSILARVIQWYWCKLYNFLSHRTEDSHQALLSSSSSAGLWDHRTLPLLNTVEWCLCIIISSSINGLVLLSWFQILQPWPLNSHVWCF